MRNADINRALLFSEKKANYESKLDLSQMVANKHEREEAHNLSIMGKVYGKAQDKEIAMKKRAKAEREDLEMRMDKLREKQELTTQAFERRA